MSSLQRTLTAISAAIILVLLLAFVNRQAIQTYLDATPLDRELRNTIRQHEITPIDLGPEQDAAKVELGQLLFFDKELSGNRDTSCATCHHPDFAGADGRSLPIGTGGEGLGPRRVLGKGRKIVPRNAPELFNRGSAEWETMFWDGRVAADIYSDGVFISPADTLLPTGLDSALAAQAMFPPTSRDEMRGDDGDKDSNGTLNEVALAAPDDPTETWALLTDRLMSIPTYQQLFANVYPDVAPSEIGFEHAANAIAAFEIDAFSFNNSPWEQFLAGDNLAMTDYQKEGATLFYGKANCVACHSGSLMTDQAYHNIAVPQLGPGKNNSGGLDFGRFLETTDQTDLFAFRTPPLANIALTAPYMHNGAYATLEGAVRHHLSVNSSLTSYNPTQIDSSLIDSVKKDVNTHTFILSTLDPLMVTPINLTETEVDQLLQFLHALTAPSATDLSLLIPDTVPSGLPLLD